MRGGKKTITFVGKKIKSGHHRVPQGPFIDPRWLRSGPAVHGRPKYSRKKNKQQKHIQQLRDTKKKEISNQILSYKFKIGQW